MAAPSSRAPRGLRERLGAAVDYLESNLGEAIDLDQAARCADFSRSHFMRLFQAAVGLPVGEYVRRRRLSLAAEALAAGRPVLATALDWGYESQAAFTRAFTREFRVTPASYARGVRAGGALVELFLPYEPRLPDVSAEVPAPTLVEKAPARVVGVATRFSVRAGQALTTIPAFWEAWFVQQRWRPLGGDPARFPLGVSNLRANGDLDYLIGLEAEPEAPVPHGYRAVNVPGGTYAVFSAHGVPARTAQTLVMASYIHPLPDPDVRRLPGGWDLEAFRAEPGLAPGELRCELWIPLQGRAPPTGKVRRTNGQKRSRPRR